MASAQKTPLDTQDGDVEIHLPDKFTILLHQCIGCNYWSSQKSNVQTHQLRFEECLTAGIRSQKVCLCRFPVPQPASSSDIAVTDVAGAAIAGSHNHHNTAVNINIHLHHFPADVVPARTDDEADRMLEVLGQEETMDMVFFSDKLADIFGTAFTHTKGSAGPADLRNVWVEGDHVYELQAGGEMRYTPSQYARTYMPTLFNVLEISADDAIERGTIHQQLARDFKRKYFVRKVAGPKNRQFTFYEAALLAVSNNAEFHKYVPGEIKQELLATLQNLTHNILPTLKRSRRTRGSDGTTARA